MSQEQYKQKSAPCQANSTANRRKRPSPAVIGAGALIAGAGLALGTLAYAYFATHPPRLRVRRTPSQVGLAYEDITFTTSDGLRLYGWFIPAPHNDDVGAVVVVCHGYPMNRAEMLPHAQMLHAAGFATLLFDFRALGESDGDLCTVGHYEVEDLRGAVDYLESREDTAGLPVGVLGHSLGGAVGIMTAALDERIQAVVAEASYPTLKHALDARFRVFMGPLGLVMAHPVRQWAKRWVPVEAHEVSPRDAIHRIGPRAVMIIQGKRDMLVRWQDAVEMYSLAQEPRELWLLKNATHARCLTNEPEEYARRVSDFFTRHLK